MRGRSLTLYGAYHFARRVLPLGNVSVHDPGWAEMLPYWRFWIKINERTMFDEDARGSEREMLLQRLQSTSDNNAHGPFVVDLLEPGFFPFISRPMETTCAQRKSRSIWQ